MSLIERKYRQTLFGRRDPDGTIFYFDAQDFPGLKKEAHFFKTKRGDRLAGYFYSYENHEEGRIVLFEHGMGVGHVAYMREIEMLARHGYLVYSYDRTGCSESEGDGIRGFLGSVADMDSCIDMLKRDFPDKKISVIGHSWGGFSTMCAPLYHPDVAHLVAISGFVSVDTIQSQVVPFLLAFSRGKLRSVEAKENPSYISSTATEALKRTDIPVLIIHSVDDKIVSYKKNFLPLKSALADKENVRFLTVNGKNHSPNYTDDATKYKDEFFASLKRAAKKKQLETQEQRKDFVASFDWYRMTEQDEAVWSHIFNTLDM